MEDLYSKRMLACKGSDIKQAVKQEWVYEKCHFLADFEHFTTEACTDIQPRKSHERTFLKSETVQQQSAVLK